MTDYTQTKEINDILQTVEEELIQIVGKFQAQRFIGIFSDFMSLKNPTQPRNIWQEVYDAGRKSK
jgi:hypothetical protein